ncbi:MAG: TRAP transporter small permease [Alphaproteobacteria bacterium]|nr:TRAP transporter small permease [Alphaproteobacteria bacterium]
MMALVRAIRGLSTLGGMVAVCLLLVALASVCHLVFVRYVLGASAIWQHEVVSFSLIGATFLGAPYVLMTKGHVNVDLLDLYLNDGARRALAIAASTVTIAFCGLIAWLSYGWWWEAWAGDWHNETVWAPPLWIPYAAMPIGMTLLTLQALADLLAAGGITGPDPAVDTQQERGPVKPLGASK